MHNTSEKEWPYGNKNMTALDARLYKLCKEIEDIRIDLHTDSLLAEPTMRCHYNAPAEIQNLGVQCDWINRYLRITHD